MSDKSESKIIQGDSLAVMKELPDGYINTCVTSPPYWGLRDYGVDGQLGLEKTPEEYVAKMVELFREVKRVLRDDGTLWLNLGDSYAHSLRQSGKKHAGELENASKGQIKSGFAPNLSGLPEKNLVGIPWRVAFALQADGWYLRQDIIWHKPNPMPESVRDRCTKAHEYVFLLSKSKKYYFDNEGIKEQASQASQERYKYSFGSESQKNRKMNETVPTGKKEHLIGITTRNKRSVWTVTTKPYKEAHFATFPEKLIEPMILAGCHKGGVVLDPFFGAGTTGVVAKKQKKQYIGIELNPEYIKIAKERLSWVLL